MKVYNSIYAKSLSLFLIFSIIGIQISYAGDNKIKLPAGTTIYLELQEFLNTYNSSEGQTVNLIVKDNIIVDNKIVIRAGENAYAQITELVKPSGKGKPGYISVRVDNVRAVDGTIINLGGSELSNVGKDNTTFAWLVGLGGCLVVPCVGIVAVFFVEGEDAYLRAGSTVKAITASDHYILAE